MVFSNSIKYLGGHTVNDPSLSINTPFEKDTLKKLYLQKEKLRMLETDINKILLLLSVMFLLLLFLTLFFPTVLVR